MTSTEAFIAHDLDRHRNGEFLDLLARASQQVAARPGAAADRFPASAFDQECTHRIVRESGFVAGSHPCYVKVSLQTTLCDASIDAHTHAAIDRVMAALVGDAHQWRYNPILVVLPALCPLPGDADDNHLRLDLDVSTGLAAVACSLRRGPRPGTWYTRADTPAPGEKPRLIRSCHSPDDAFRTDAAVPAELVPRIVHEFCNLNGRGPTLLRHWRPAERSTGDTGTRSAYRGQRAPAVRRPDTQGRQGHAFTVVRRPDDTGPLSARSAPVERDRPAATPPPGQSTPWRGAQTPARTASALAGRVNKSAIESRRGQHTMSTTTSERPDTEDAFVLDVQVIIDATSDPGAARCSTNDGCAPSCASSCASRG